MATQGLTLSDEQVEIIKATFAETGSVRAASRAANVSVATAKKYADNRDEFEQLRTAKRADIITRIGEIQIALLDAMIEPKRLKDAGLSTVASAFATLTEKRLLMSGEATSRTETMATDTAVRLTPDEKMLAAQLRDKLMSDGA